MKRITFLTFVVACLGYGEMMALRAKAVATALVRLENIHKKRPLTQEEKDLKLIAQVAQNVFDIQTVSVMAGGSEEELTKRIDVRTITEAIVVELNQESEWKNAPSASAKKMISDNRAALEKIFASNSYVWSWFQLQLGEKDAAKKNLQSLYENEYKEVMALQRAVFGLHGTPLTEAEQLHRALGALAEPAEKAAIEDKMQKMKIHISNLPQSHIVT